VLNERPKSNRAGRAIPIQFPARWESPARGIIWPVGAGVCWKLPRRIEEENMEDEEKVFMDKALTSAEELKKAHPWLTEEMIKDISISMFIDKMRRRR
jgi:hypothetical protein